MRKLLRITEKYLEFYVKPFQAHSKTIFLFVFTFLNAMEKFCRKYILRKERQKERESVGG